MPDRLKLILSILLCEAIGLLGTIFTVTPIQEWYAFLNRPVFSPPNWVFGPVWTALYALMGISLYLVVQAKASKKKKQSAYFFFGSQLILNFLWSVGFFGLRSPLLGLGIIVTLWGVIFLNIKAFTGISKNAAYLLVPYILWVSFALLLNFAILWLN